MDERHISHLSSIVFGGPVNMHAVQVLHKFHLVFHFLKKVNLSDQNQNSSGEIMISCWHKMPNNKECNKTFLTHF